MKKEVKTLLIFAIAGAVAGCLLGIGGGGGGVAGGIWFGCGFGCAIEYLRSVLLRRIDEKGFSRGLGAFFNWVALFFLVVFTWGGPVTLLIRYFKVK